MIPLEIRFLLARDPFESFRIRLVNGDSHDVVHAHLAVILDEGVYLLLPDGHCAQFPFDRVASLESLIVFDA